VLLTACSGAGGAPAGGAPAGTTRAAAVAPAATGAVPDALVPTTGCRRPPEVAAGRTTPASLESSGRKRTYRLHLPAGYDPNRPIPLILAFHARNGTGADLEHYTGLDALGAVVAYPRGLPGPDGQSAWQGAPLSVTARADDVRFVSDLLDHLQRTLCIDAVRIYATGKSEGAGLTALLSCRMPRRIAAFATVSGAFYPGTGAGCPGAPPTPLLDFHGTADKVIHYEGGVRHQVRYPSMTDWLARRAEYDRCGTATITSIGSDVTQISWPACAPRAALVHYRVSGGGHTWPGATALSGPGGNTRTVSATALSWEFFTAHPLPAPPP
jgi:polyhydroxybutyrate depolymerase